MKRYLKLCYILLFMAACSIPVFTMPLFAESESAEKRNLQERPSLWQEGEINADYREEMEDYISDHFSFRASLVAGWSKLKAGLFATSAEDAVIIGKEDWLYFAETTADYTQISVLSEEEVDRIVKILTMVDEYVESKGGTFLFFVAPNKNTVYPEYMPYYYLRGTQETNLDRLNQALKDQDFYLDLAAVLKKYRTLLENCVVEGPEFLYHKRDSHWNNYGAAVAFEAIMAQRELAELINEKAEGDDDKWQGYDHVNWLSRDYQMTEDWEGDLDQMLFPTGGILDCQVRWKDEPEFSYRSSFHSPEDLLIQTTNPEKEGSLLMFRDSFGNALYPYLGEEFGTAEFLRVVPYRLFDLEKNPRDTVMIELVERNIPNILKTAPVLPAPRRQPAQAEECKVVTMYQRNYQGMLHVYGALEHEETGNLYVGVAQNGNIEYYEAFPVLEEELLEQTEKEQVLTGFSCYLPLEDWEDLELKIFVEREEI